MSNQKIEIMTTKKEVSKKKTAAPKAGPATQKKALPTMKELAEEAKAAKNPVAKKAEPKAKAEPRETNVNMAKRLLKEKATPAQIQAAYTKAYASKTSDKDFIAKRASIYMEIAKGGKVVKKAVTKPAAKKPAAKKPAAKK